MTRIKELGRYLSVRTTRTGQTSPLNFHPNYQDPAESVRWVNLRLLENPAAGMWDKEENDLRRFAAGIISYPGGRVSLLCWMHSAISGLPEHPPEDVRVVPLSSYPELAKRFVPNTDSTALNGAIMRAKEGFSMARFMLCFILLAAALGHATQPQATLDQSVPTSDLAVLGLQMATASGQVPLAATASPNDIALAANNEGTCYKIRAYIFKRDDDHAPQFVRSTTCGPGQPHTKDAVWPKARMVPAD